jgi:phosphate butyryltransferase
MFRTLAELVAAARAKGRARIAVAAGHDPAVIAALKEAAELQLAEGILVGDGRKIRALGREVGYDIPDRQIIDEPNDAAAAKQAIALVRNHNADFLMKGKIGTAPLIRAVIDRETGLRKGLLSQVIVFQVPGIDRLMLMTDAAINIAPGIEQKADICRNAIAVARAIGIEKPNVAALCALEQVNSEMPATVDAAALAAMSRRGQISGAFIEGPIALDAPLSRFAAEKKGIDSPIVENTDIFIAPNIEAGNILYRAITYFARGDSGGVVVGAQVPLVLLSRAEPPSIKINSISIAILLSDAARQAEKAKARW